MSDSTNSFIVREVCGVAVFQNPCSEVKIVLFFHVKTGSFYSNLTWWVLHNHGTQFFLELLMVILQVEKFPA